jgi:hypothetical protein
LRVAKPLGRGLQTRDRGGKCIATWWRVQVSSQLEDRRVVNRRIPVEISAGSEDE